MGNGSIPGSADGSTVGGQTSPTGGSKGKTATGPMSPASAGKDKGNLGVVGALPGGGGAPAKNVKNTKDKQPTRPVATFLVNSNDSIAVLGQPVTLDVILSNPNRVGFNKLGFAIEYNPEFMIPIINFTAGTGEYSTASAMVTSGSSDAAQDEDKSSAASSSNQKTNTLGQFLLSKSPERYTIKTNEIDSKKGRILFSMDVKDETSVDTGIVARVDFMPLKETPKSSIKFDMTTGVDQDTNHPLTFLSLNEKDQLGSSSYDPSDGVINFDMEIVSSLDKIKERPIVKKENQHFSNKGDDVFDTSITLIPRQKEVEVGETIDFDVYVANPNKDPIDAVSVFLAYNPRVFEPVDTDDYETGININDKEYVTNFPFDFPLTNSIDDEKGLIDFRKRVNRSPVRGEGVLATIRLKAIRPTQKTTLKILMSENGEEPTTGLFYRKTDRLGDPSDPSDGVKTTSIAIRPSIAYLNKIKASMDKG